MPQRPNVLIFCVDQMRADHMGCAGNPIVRTPHLDSLAARGVRFSRAYCNNPICMPARASMFTGLLPRDHGLRINGQTLRPDIPTLPTTLAEAGYRTHAAGKLHLSPWVPMVEPPEPQRFPECLDYWNRDLINEFPTPYFGFQSVDYVGGHTTFISGAYLRWLRERGGDITLLRKPKPASTGAPKTFITDMPEELHYNRYIADSTIECIERASSDATPFFIWCSFPDPHEPIVAPARYAAMHEPDQIPLPPRRDGELDDLPAMYAQIMRRRISQNGGPMMPEVTDEQWRQMIALTYGMVTHIDTEIGRVLRRLEASNAADNTLIVFLSDHGDMMGDHRFIWKGPFTYQGCIRVPMIVAPPRDTSMDGGRVCDRLVAQVDLLPSILDACDVPLPGSDWRARETPFKWEQVRPLNLFAGHSWTPLLRNERDQPIRDAVVIENDSPATGYHMRCLVTESHRMTIYPGADTGELFDLQADPDELHNLWARPEAHALRARLTQQLLERYARETPLYPVPPWNS